MVAKIRPKASTLNAKSIPGKKLNNVHLIGPSFRTNGVMDITVKKSNMLPIIVQLSLMFGRLPDNKMRKEAMVGHRIAKNGLYSMANNSVMMLPLIYLSV